MEQNNPYAAPASEVALDHSAQQFDDGKWYSPSGRLGRARYFLRSFGYYFVFLLLTGVLTAIGSLASPEFAPMLSIPLAIAYVVVALSQGVKRLHDLNWSGWWLLLFIIPIVNFVLALLLLFKAGTDGPNDYGYPAYPAKRAGLWIGLALGTIILFGILAAIAIPAYEDYINRAQSSMVE
jgi:uncharacterized membrane protein YhaH (DUF805 family)